MRKFLILKILLLVLIPNFIFANENTDPSIVKYGENFSISENEKYNNIMIFGGNLKVAGKVNNISVFGGNLTIERTADITGNVNLYGGDLILNEGASKPNNYNKAPIQSELVKTLISPEAIATSLEAKNLFRFNFNTNRDLLFFILGLILLWFFEKPINNIMIGIKTKPIMTPIYGLIAWICFSPIMFLLIVSLLGIALIPFLILFYIISSIFGWTAISVLVGKLIFEKWKPDLSIFVYFILGSIILIILCFLPIISFIISIIGAFYALGAVVITKFGQRHIYG